MKIRRAIGSILSKFTFFKYSKKPRLNPDEFMIHNALIDLERSFRCWFNPERFLQAIQILAEQKNNPTVLQHVLTHSSQKRCLTLYNSLCRKEVDYLLAGLRQYIENSKGDELNEPDNIETITQQSDIAQTLTTTIKNLRPAIFSKLKPAFASKTKKNKAKQSVPCKPEALHTIQFFIGNLQKQFINSTVTNENLYKNFTLG